MSFQRLSSSFSKPVAAKLINARSLTSDHTSLDSAFGTNEYHVPKPFYITTPLFYPNSSPHIGHLYTLVIADIFARFRRLLEPSKRIHFLTGTDEHGLKIQKAAYSRGLLPNTFCDSISEQFRNLEKTANISNTIFLRTTERRHYESVQHVWRHLSSLGLIYKGSYSGWYSVADESFNSDAQVIRTLQPDGSEKTISNETGAVVEPMEEENYMFRLSSFRQALLAHYSANPAAIRPAQYLAEVVATLKSGQLQDLSISRPRIRLDWGIRVPDDPEHTIYVWFDALTAYLTGIGYPWNRENSSQQGWPPDLQVIGKDILRFHAIYLPAMLMALSLPLPRTLLTHAHWTINKKKMSKSVGIVADPLEAMNTYGVDVVRYYLARVGGRFRDDVDWSHEQLQKYSQEIQSLLGNFYLRVTSTKIITLKASATVPPSFGVFERSLCPENFQLLSHVTFLPDEVESALESSNVGDALQHIADVLALANHTFTMIAPWSQDPSTAQESYIVSLEVLRICGICLQPFMPTTSMRLLQAIGISPTDVTWERARVRDEGWLDRSRIVARSAAIFDFPSLRRK